MYGEPNRGKSTLLKYVKDIFYCEDLKIVGGRFTVDTSNLEHDPQIVTMDEVKKSLFIQQDFQEEMKQLLEG